MHPNPWTLVGLCLVAVLFYFKVFIPETLDQTCPNGGYTNDPSLCGRGRGVDYVGSEPLGGDTKSVLLDKIVMAATVCDREVIWRRAMLVAAISVILYALTQGGQVGCAQAFILLLMVFLASYGMSSLTTFHHYKFPRENLLRAVDQLRRIPS